MVVVVVVNDDGWENMYIESYSEIGKRNQKRSFFCLWEFSFLSVLGWLTGPAISAQWYSSNGCGCRGVHTNTFVGPLNGKMGSVQRSF